MRSRVGILLTALAVPGCFAPSLPAVDCGDGNICPDGLVCRLPERVCERPTGDAGADALIPIDAADAASPVALVSRGLVSRYLMNEAASGTAPPMLTDIAANPVHLALDYGSNASFTEEDDGNRGLFWAAEDGLGEARAPIDGTKLGDLDGGNEFTIEVVFDVALSASRARISHFGSPGNDGDSTIRVRQPDILELRYFNGLISTDWPGALVDGERNVVHIIFKAEEPIAEDRLRAYVGGVRATDVNGATLDNNDTLEIDADAELIIGNQPGGMRSPNGVIFYFAIYDQALTDAELAANAARLAVDDDAP